MDPYYRVKSDILQKRPTYGYCMIAVMLIMASLAGFFGYYLFNVEPYNACFVKKNSDSPIHPLPLGIDEDPSVTDVSK